MTCTTIFFDLDDTLYPSSTGLWQAIRERMADFMQVRLGFPAEEVPIIRKHYFETYGTTLRGLQKHHQVDSDEYLAYVHDLPLREFISPDPELRYLIQSLPQKKWIFTNADADHAERVLEILELEGCFDGIIDVRALGFLCKPDPEAYRRALALAGGPIPTGCLLLDDSPRNLEPAFKSGFRTVLVGSAEPNPFAQFSVRTPKELPRIMPELWQTQIAGM
jgi:putative hydrolase of the HAD superfamily